MTKQIKQTPQRGAGTSNGSPRRAVAGKKESGKGKKKVSKKVGRARQSLEVKDTTRKRQAIVVLGMHRSGTSALTRVLNLCGATLPKELMKPVANNNDLGFWEPARIYEVHERLFAEIGTSWDDVGDVAASFQDSNLARQFQREISGLVREEFGDAALFVIKDPRICRLVPFWRKLLEETDAEVVYVLPIRNPLEVALSLQARDGMATNLGLLLWLRHFLSAERDSRGMPRSFCRFEDLLDDWRSVVERIGFDLGISFPRMSARAGAEIDEFLVDAARHQRQGDEEVLARRDVLSWVKTAYRWALAASSDGPAPSPTVLDELDELLTAAESAFGPIVATEQVRSAEAEKRVSGFETEVRNLRSSLDSKAVDRENLESDLSALERRLAQSSEESNRLARQLEFRDEELTTLMEWSKTVVRWASETITGNVPASPQLGQLLQSLEMAPAKEIPMLASEGFGLAERDSWQTQVRKAEKEADEAGLDRDAAKAEALALKHKCQSAEADLVVLRSEFQATSEQLKDVTRQFAEAVQAGEKANQERDEAGVEVTELRLTLAETEREQCNLAEELRSARGDCDEAGSAVTRLEDALAETERRQGVLEGQFTSARLERDDALTKHNIADAKRERLRAQFDEVVEAGEAERTEHSAERAKQSARLEECDKTIEGLNQMVRGLENAEHERDGALTELVRSEEVIGTRDKQILALDGERLNIAESLTEMRLERDTARGRIETLAVRLKEAQQAVVDLKEKIDGLGAERARHNNEMNELEQDLRAKQLATEERDALVVIQRRELERIKSSTVWKLARPFRAVVGVGKVASVTKRSGGDGA